MRATAFFCSAASLARANATYSRDIGAWIVAVPYLQLLFRLQLKDRPPGFSYGLVLEEGVRRGFWELQFDDEHLSQIVVVR